MADGIDLSHSELRSLITKAARGAGLAWGLAEEAGWAAEWLARRGFPAADWAAHWLSSAVAGGLTPVALGAALADDFAKGPAAFPPQSLPDALLAPGYLLPFLARIAQNRGDLALTTTLGLAAEIGADGTLRFGPAWSDRTLGWTLAQGVTEVAGQRPRVSTSVLDCLDGLALRTTVPPSDLSRRQAGSATPDDD